MEENSTETVEEQIVHEEEENVCKGCGSSSVVDGYTIPLCAECREKYSHHPVPVPIKIFAVVILAIMVFALIQFPKSLGAGIAFERGERAEQAKKYATAAREYAKVVEIFPGSFIASGKLFIAYAKNQNFDEAGKAFELIKGKQSKNSDEIKIIDEANASIQLLDSYYDLDEELATLLSQLPGDLQGNLAIINDYTVKHPDQYYGYFYLADMLFELERYADAQAAYSKAVSLKPELYLPRLELAAAYRQTGEFEKAVSECNKVLLDNPECSDAYASLCKIDIKRHQYKTALDNALKAYSLDDKNPSVTGSLALAYHFEGMKAESEAKLAVLKEADATYYDYIKDIIDGKSKMFE